MWKEINWSRREMRLHLPSYISNLTFLGQDIVLLDPQHPQPAMLFRIQWDCEPDQALAWTDVENRLIFDLEVQYLSIHILLFRWGIASTGSLE